MANRGAVSNERKRMRRGGQTLRPGIAMPAVGYLGAVIMTVLSFVPVTFPGRITTVSLIAGLAARWRLPSPGDFTSSGRTAWPLGRRSCRS
jgi:hypothetical protein